MTLRSILEFDAGLSGRMRVAEKPGKLRSMAVFFCHSGDSWFWAAALIPLWFFSNSMWRHWEVVEFGGICVLAPIVLAIKFSVRRPRPEGKWGTIYRVTDPHSFPSGHAARAFMIAIVATALAPTWLAVILWIWAPLVAIARVAMGVHYVSDIVAGAIFGSVVALIGLQIHVPIMLGISNLIGIHLW